MPIELLLTSDHSYTLYHSELDETYHSKKGAIAESQYVYIEKGLAFVADQKKVIKVFEFGFGTGLNALLSWIYSEEKQKNVVFETVEKYPLPAEIYSKLNYAELTTSGNKLASLHHLDWNSFTVLSEYFSFQKFEMDFSNLALPNHYYDLVYFDAFAPSKQAEVWQIEVLEKLTKAMVTGAVLVTYCSQGNFRRNLEQLGFVVEKLPGPLGKREMIRAIKG